MMNRTRRLMLLSLVIASLLGGAAIAAAPLGLDLTMPEVGVIGQEGGETYAIALQGTFAYVGIGPRLVVVDVTTPVTPTLAGRGPVLPDLVRDIAPTGDTAFVAAGASGIHGISIVDVSAPQWVSSLDTPGWASGVASSGNHLYVADKTGGLRIVDVSNPQAPTEVATITSAALGGQAEDVAVAAGIAYVGAGAGGLVLVDVGNPTAPSIVGNYPGPIATDVTVNGTTAYIIDGADLEVLAIDVSDPGAPTLIHDRPSTGVPSGLAVHGLHLYVTAGESGLDIFEVDPEAGSLSYQTTYATPGVAHGVVIAGLHAYVADGPSGLHIVDVLTDPGSPTAAADYQTLGDALGLDADSDHAYVAAGEDGLSILDVTDATQPVRVGAIDTPGYAQTVALNGTLAYIADGEGGLTVVDVANPESPILLGQLPSSGEGEVWRSVAVEGNVALVAAETNGLRIIDVAVPTAPAPMGSLVLGNGHGVWDVAVDGDYAYVAAGLGGLRVVQIADLAAPIEVASLVTDDWAWDVTVADGYLYIADIDGGLQIVDVTTPTSPAHVSAYTGALGAVTAVTVSGRHALVTTENAVAVLDIANPAAPALRATYPTAGTPQAVAVNDAVLLTDLDGGLRVLDPVDVAITLTTIPASALIDQPATLTLTAINHGPALGSGVVLTSTLPAGLTFGDASPSCVATDNIVTCPIGNLSGGASRAVTVTVSASTPGIFQTGAVVSSGATEIWEQNNAVASNLTVLGDLHRVYIPLVQKQ